MSIKSSFCVFWQKTVWQQPRIYPWTPKHTPVFFPSVYHYTFITSNSYFFSIHALAMHHCCQNVYTYVKRHLYFLTWNTWNIVEWSCYLNFLCCPLFLSYSVVWKIKNSCILVNHCLLLTKSLCCTTFNWDRHSKTLDTAHMQVLYILEVLD